MRNLKKLFAVIVAICIIFTFAVPAFAAEAKYSSEAATLNTLHLYDGISTSTFVPDLGTAVDRQTSIALLVKVLGKKDAALAMAAADVDAALATFTDAKDVAIWAKPYMAYAIKNGLTNGTSATTLSPKAAVTGNMFATFILRNLGYTVDNFNYGLATLQSKGGLTPVQASDFNKNLIKDDIVGIAYGALQAADATNKKLVENLIAAKVFTEEEAVKAGVYTASTFAIADVSATSATQLKVTFTQAPLETTTTVSGTTYTGAEDTSAYLIAGVHPTSAVLDGKTVTLTMGSVISGTMLYTVNPICLATDVSKATAIYTKVETYSDTVAPAVASVTYPTYDTVTVTFTEPMKSLGAVTATQSGSAITLTQTTAFAAGASSVTYSIANATADTAITFVMVGAVDQANNIITPNPATLTFTKTKTDTTAPTVVSVTPLSNVKLKVTFSEKLSAAPTVLVGVNPVTFDASDDGITWTGTFSSTTGVAVVSVNVYADMSGNAGTATTKLAQFVKDTTAPTLVSSEVKVFNGTAYAVFHFSEDVTPAGLVSVSGTYVASYITKTLAATSVTAIAYTKANGADADDTKAVMFNISNDTTFPVGTYTIALPAGFVSDEASPVNALAATTATFSKGSAAVDTGAPTVNATPAFAADNSYLDVVFSEAMDPATALNVANYKIGGASIFTSAAFIGDALHVRLTVNPGTITYTGLYNVTVSGVKDAAGNVMTAYAGTMTVEENVKPYVASAKLTNSTTITVTYSEQVMPVAAADFEVYVAGTKVDAVTTVVNTLTGTATITLAAAIDDLSKAIQVKLVNSAEADVYGNTAKTGDLVTVAY